MTNKLLCSLLAVGLFSVPCRSQVEDSREIAVDRPSSFVMDPLVFEATDSAASRIDLLFQVGYDNLTFVKTGSAFGAIFELTATVLDSMGSAVREQSWSDSIAVPTFEATVVPAASRAGSRSFVVPPGRFTVSLELRDEQSKSARRIQKVVTVPDFRRAPLSLSSAMIVARLTQQGAKRNVVPNVSPNVGSITDAFYLFLEAYDNARLADTLIVTGVVANRKGETIMEVDTTAPCPASRNEVFLRVPHAKLSVGDYVITVNAQGRSHKELQASTKRAFEVRWHGLPLSLDNLDEAVEQLRYIATSTELDSIKSAPTQEEKKERFFRFWKKKDPNPNTLRNERMEEFYGRVDYANRHFSHYIVGWKSDMGMVYIIFGPPSNVERHPFEVDSKPYEIWSYYGVNQSFVFVDATGFGEYRLVTPLWDVYRNMKQ